MAIVVLPVALVSGLQFPLLVALLGQGRAAVSRQLGMAYAWNTLGAIAGSLVGGFGALPLLTAPGTWRAASLMLAVLSLDFDRAIVARGGLDESRPWRRCCCWRSSSFRSQVRRRSGVTAGSAPAGRWCRRPTR